MNKVNKFIDWISNMIFQPGQVESRGYYIYFQMLELLIISLIITYAWNWAPYISRIQDVVLPLGLAQYISVHFMFDDLLPYLNAGIITLACAAGFLRLNKFSYLIAVFAIHFQYISRYSLGEISHGSNMAGLCLLALAVAAILYKDGIRFRKFSFGMILFFMGLAYTSAAVCKLIGTGPLWIDGRHLWLWIGERSVDVLSADGSFQLNVLQEFTIQWYWLATIILFFGLATEAVGVMVWSSFFRPFIVLLLVGMHFGIEWTMNISFSSYVYVLILAGFPWFKLIDYALDRLNYSSLNNMIDRFQGDISTPEWLSSVKKNIP
ncbi:MAG: hypothetical protein LAT67_05305 [Balneolales bacterium]|nr:hypothetical protein [Balneolales bacterium]